MMRISKGETDREKSERNIKDRLAWNYIRDRQTE